VRRLFHLAIPLCLLIVSAAARTPDVTSVSVSMPVVVNQPATVAVTGTNPCGAVQIDFGDAQVIVYPISQLPFSIDHTWTTTGAKTVTAVGMGNCAGQASTTIDVKTSGGGVIDLCKYVDCGGLVDALKPKITAVLSVSRPGGVGAVVGKNFGAVKGTVVAHLKRWDGSDQLQMLGIGPWSPTMIEIHWPSNISKVMDQDTTLQVTTANQVKTNEWPIVFRAALESTVIPWNELKDVTCGTDSNADTCGTTWDADDESDILFGLGGTIKPWTAPCGGTICGSHENVWGAIGDDSDNDVFVLPKLKNGWQLSGLEKLAWNTSGGSLSGPSGFQPNGTEGTLTMKWTVTPNDDVAYDIAVNIAGPRGVPHK
jgi:hypothetical protein